MEHSIVVIGDEVALGCGDSIYPFLQAGITDRLQDKINIYSRQKWSVWNAAISQSLIMDWTANSCTLLEKVLTKYRKENVKMVIFLFSVQLGAEYLDQALDKMKEYLDGKGILMRGCLFISKKLEVDLKRDETSEFSQPFAIMARKELVVDYRNFMHLTFMQNERLNSKGYAKLAKEFSQEIKNDVTSIEFQVFKQILYPNKS